MNLILPKRWSAVAFILSSCSYLYELLLIQFASELSNNNFLIINLSLGTFILGLGLGLKELPEIESPEKALQKLSLVERDLCLLALLSWVLIQLADFTQQHFIGLILTKEITEPWFTLLLDKYHLYILVASILSSLLIGFKSGQELPLILKIASPQEQFTAYFFALTYLGSVAASFSLNFILKNFLNSSQILLVTVLINLVVYITISKKNLSTITQAMGILLLTGLFFKYQENIEQYTLKNYFYHYSAIKVKPSDLGPIFTKETAYQKINIHEFKNHKILSLNRQFQFSFSNEEVYHDALVHIPLKMTKHFPKKVLLLGGGDGLALREILKYDKIEHITHIELDPEFTEFCRTHPQIKKLNNGSLEPNSRVSRFYGDAFYLIKKESTKYDYIIIDFPYPFSYDLWKLYSLEFYLSLQKKISKDGIIVLDAPVQSEKVAKHIGNSKSKEINSVLYSTIKAANFKTINFFSFQKEGFIVLSTKEITLKKSNLDNIFLSPVTSSKLHYLQDETFEYEFNQSLINSIFEPKLLNFTRDF